MNIGKISRKKLLSGLVFCISPIAGLIVLLHKINRDSFNLLYILLSLFFALMVLKNPPLYDLIRYLELFDSSGVSIGLELHNYLSFQIISSIFKILDIPFYFLPSLFVFFIMYFHLKAIGVVYDYYNWSIKKQLILIFGLVILLNPIFASTVLRAYMASGLFMYGTFLIIFSEKKRGYLYVGMSILFHLSFAYLVLFFLVSRVIKIEKTVAFIVSCFAITISLVFISYLIDLIPFELVKIQFSNYLTDNNTGADAGAGNFQAVIINCIIVLTHILLCLIYFLTRIPKAEKAFEYSNLVNFMIIAGSLTSISFTLFTRFFSHISLFTFVYIMIFIIFISKNKIVSFALSLILLVNFLLIDVYIRKDSLLNGSPIAMVTVTPLQIFLYSDMEYREMLKNINYHGDIIND